MENEEDDDDKNDEGTTTPRTSRFMSKRSSIDTGFVNKKVLSK
jgi:hypothetical protein